MSKVKCQKAKSKSQKLFANQYLAKAPFKLTLNS
jgi:hypothetical protein